MPRPRRRRKIRGRPSANYFKPRGIPLSELNEIELELPEFEALRLIDVQNIPQHEAAKKMDVSQPTFSRILTIARKKLSEAVIEGKAIKVEKLKNLFEESERR